jgi:hypothetical protein
VLSADEPPCLCATGPPLIVSASSFFRALMKPLFGLAGRRTSLIWGDHSLGAWNLGFGAWVWGASLLGEFRAPNVLYFREFGRQGLGFTAFAIGHEIKRGAESDRK